MAASSTIHFQMIRWFNSPKGDKTMIEKIRAALKAIKLTKNIQPVLISEDERVRRVFRPPLYPATAKEHNSGYNNRVTGGIVNL